MEIFGSTNGILMTIIIGFLVGIVAKFLKPGKDPGGFIITILLGIAGSFIATFIGKTLGWYQPGQTAGFIGSVIGAIILLVIYGIATRKK
ncbi:GlsB/YeaQ/YmgE family stress response membrane protein [Dokdonella sp.]|uniref:GlsB/YeaQ/YmgE family stress response membrane protein n=1 Tax=Dokdonella sp. TaxID=2291710 RepID=UPI003C50860F